MLTENKVSIAMATYNGSKFLNQQLDSIINLTYKCTELIIVDDCSSDNTIEIINSYIDKYHWIKLYQNVINIGAVKSFEKAINLCSGDYIALSDQDDVWFPNKLQTLLDNIEENLLIHSDAVLVDEHMNIVANSYFSTIKNKKLSGFTDYLLMNNVTGCTMLFSRKLFELAMPIPEGFYIHDHYLAIVASFHGTIKLLDEPLVYYRQHDSNSIGAARSDFNQFMTSCKFKAESLKSLLSTPQFKNSWQIQLLSDYRISLYIGKWQGEYSKFKLLSLKDGWKHLLFYYIMRFMGRTKMSIKIYNFIRKYY